MTPLPKRRWSTRRQGKHRASLKIKLPTLNLCPNCQTPKKVHFSCPNCGQYLKNEKSSRPSAPKTAKTN